MRDDERMGDVDEFDPELLAALLDGRIVAAERERMLAMLSTADDDYYMFTHAAAILRELEEEG